MGGAVSSLDRQAVIKATEQPRFLMNSILDYIIKNIRENDVFRMQDPTVCKEFLLLSADSLDRLFKHIDVNPQTDRSGKIYFERVSRLTAPAAGSPAEGKRKLTCLAIAYFYVRILQIYLALAFTLIDDPALVPGRTPPALGVIPGNRAILPGREIGVYQRGGRKSELLTFSMLVDKRVLEKDGNVYRFTGGNKNVYIIPDSDSGKADRIGVVRIEKERITTTGGIEKVPSQGAVKIHLKGVGQDRSGAGIPNRIVIEKVNIAKSVPQQYAFGGVVAPLVTFEYEALTPALQLDLDDSLGSLKSPYKYQGLSALHSVFNALVSDLENPQVGLRNIRSAVARAEKKEDVVAGAAAAAGQGIAAKAAARVSSNLKEGTSEKALKFQESVKLVASVRPLAHCITRSFQLLDVDALGSKVPKSARTHICQSKFDTGSAGYIAAPPNGSITDIPGLKALNFLFFVLEQVIHLSGRTEDQLRTALDALAKTYGQEMKFPKVDIDSMATIKPRTPTVCSGVGGQARYLNPAGISVARSGVGRLWAYQRSHAAKVEAIFKKLFEIGRSGDKFALAFNENLFKKGIPEVEKISEEARNLLTLYYGECEEIYQDTVNKLGEGNKFDTGRETAERGAIAAAAPPKRR